jgi:hypothetical protein
VVVTLTEAVAGLFPLTEMGLGEAEHFEAFAVSLHERDTISPNPFVPEKLKLYVAVWPADTVAEADEPEAMEMEKSGCVVSAELILATKASLEPPGTAWNGLTVGKFVESVLPVI